MTNNWHWLKAGDTGKKILSCLDCGHQVVGTGGLLKWRRCCCPKYGGCRPNCPQHG